MYKALIIKNWIISHISPWGWSMLISRALPELLESNPDFSAFYLGNRTKWDLAEVRIIDYYLKKLYNLSIPKGILVEDIQLPADYLDLANVNFLAPSTKFKSIYKKLFSFFKTSHT